MLRWSHDGVSMRTPVRFATRLRARAGVLIVALIGATIAASRAIEGPSLADPTAVCITDPAFCEALAPTWRSWEHSPASWREARVCSLTEPPTGWDVFGDHRLVGHVLSASGLSSAKNQEFLALVARQRPCGLSLPPTSGPYEGPSYWHLAADPAARDVDPEQALRAAMAQADYEYARLQYLEEGIRAERAGVMIELENARKLQRAATMWAWAPLGAVVLAALWLIALALVWRWVREARPSELAITGKGVRLDGAWVPDVAALALDGHRVRIDRRDGPAVWSRPLPADALEALDGLVGAFATKDGGTAASIPAALQALLSARRTTLSDRPRT